ncbi:MAG: S24/S26 family peptidase, partial [Anaerolineae bacterium]|nr:S24/S26 family peptidase [Anaerolineae bacterium]
MMQPDIRKNVLAPRTKFRVSGNSMLPTIQPGDEVIVSPVDRQPLRPGDLVVISTGQSVYVHRFLYKTDQDYVTKGDNNHTPDPLWRQEVMKGLVLEVWRDNQCIYTRTPDSIKRNRLLASKHRLTGFIWQQLRRFKTIITALVMALLITSV